MGLLIKKEIGLLFYEVKNSEKRVCLMFERFERFLRFLRFEGFGRFLRFCSKGWAFRKARAAFPYFLFLVSYSLFPCVFAPLRALRETKKVQEVGKSRLPMLVFRSIIKEEVDCL
jgi:hypothetical protein